MTSTRPVLRYHGGKWRLAPWIISHFPAHRIYVEPYGGAASVLMRKPRAFAEVYNDLDEDVVNVFRVLRDPESAEDLRRQLEFTPWSRMEFLWSYELCTNPIERARRTIVRAFMAHGSTHRSAHRTGFRARISRTRTKTGAHDWVNWPAQVPHFVERLSGVTIECRPALEVIAQQDGLDTLFYLDPPYPFGVRSAIRNQSEKDGGRAYIRNLTDEEHRELAEVLHQVEGMVVISGYVCPLYEELFGAWERVDREALADAGARRIESLWISPNARRLQMELGA